MRFAAAAAAADDDDDDDACAILTHTMHVLVQFSCTQTHRLAAAAN